MRKAILPIVVCALLGLGGLIYFIPSSQIDLSTTLTDKQIADSVSLVNDSVLTEEGSSSTLNETQPDTSMTVKTWGKYNDIEAQKPLLNPPKIIKAIYSTSWSAGSTKKVDYLIMLDFLRMAT